MAKLVAIIGNCGSGKTTLARLLAERLGWQLLLEQHVERPYQAAFMRAHRAYALRNQIDYLLLRAEQERSLRALPSPCGGAAGAVGAVDGGLDLDFYAFTRLFHHKGYLSDTDMALLARLHAELRAGLPPPELTIYLTAPLETLQARMRLRARPVEIVTPEDLPLLQRFLDEWLRGTPPPRLLTVEDLQFTSPAELDTLIQQIIL